jgi:hypothetical protein
MNSQRQRKPKPSGLHEGDKVVMHTCSESTLDKYKNKVFTCVSEPWNLCGSEVIMLDGVKGGFATEYLKKVEAGSNGR